MPIPWSTREFQFREAAIIWNCAEPRQEAHVLRQFKERIIKTEALHAFFGKTKVTGRRTHVRELAGRIERFIQRGEEERQLWLKVSNTIQGSNEGVQRERKHPGDIGRRRHSFISGRQGQYYSCMEISFELMGSLLTHQDKVNAMEPV